MRVAERTLPFALIATPLVVFALWMISGYETLTKSVRYEEVVVVNDLFGDAETVTRPVRGPVLGHYIGLDAVCGTALLCAAAGGLLWWFRRRRRAAETRGVDE